MDMTPELWCGIVNFVAGAAALAIGVRNRIDLAAARRELSEGEGQPIDWLASVEPCEHGIPDGDWCPVCREAHQQARTEFGDS